MPAVASAENADSVRDSQQWVLGMLEVPAAWQLSEGAGVTVAVIDSGVNPSVSDLSGAVLTGPDLTGLHTSADSPSWGVHGTWMASIIAGHGHDGGGSGIIGIAPEARVLSLRVIPGRDDPGYRVYDHEPEARIQQSLATAILDAVRDGAQVISMSLGYAEPSAAVRAALQYAFARGVVVVASSGNSGQDDERRDHGYAPISFPAEYPGVIGVGALSSDGAVAGFSSNNLSVQVAAPGVNVPAQGRDGQYWVVSGTSPACALVAGVAALVKSRYRALAPGLVARALTMTTRDRPPGGYDAKIGFGTVDAAAALTEAGVLARERPAGSGAAATVTFGGGAAAVPPEPVPPRGSGQLVLDAVLALTSLALAAAAATRLAVLRRVRYAETGAGARGAHAAAFGPGPGRGAVPPPGPGAVPPPGA
ncbi:MAG: S8 family serine peptidase [Streptosporangiaceae bacterium]|nr:S8 family serine peptidase [Streptosporangiaceae bacterium]MBV9855204.1 S8 family serine peptidase [Streptosporangiaceae bacterium]